MNLSDKESNINNNTDFVLSKKQIALLDKRSKTPIEECIPANDSLRQIKAKLKTTKKVYNKEFVKEIAESEKQYKKGEYKIIEIKDLF